MLVLGEEQGAREEAQLVAAGASAVLDSTEPETELREQLVEFVEAEAAGGLDGPEAGGAEVEPRLADFQSRNRRMRELIELVRRVADSDSTLLITGETGVGKERLARAIHAESSRSAGPFVAVNCGALPENLLESELFGHEKGAFTGASERRIGRFEAADGGTLFLDEIGEMPAHLQVSLLRVLQGREIRRLGAKQPTPVDVRIISATNRDLSADIQQGSFREDLFFRLNVVGIEIPPLRERREDLPKLLGLFLRHFAEVHERPELRGLDHAATAALLDYGWPGNVREVANVLERAVLVARKKQIGVADLPGALTEAGEGPSLRSHAADGESEELLQLPFQEAKRRIVEAFERRYLEHHLAQARGAVGAAARSARINPRTLYEKMRRHGLEKRDFETPP